MANYYWRGGTTDYEGDVETLSNYRTTVSGAGVPSSLPTGGDTIYPYESVESDPSSGTSGAVGNAPNWNDDAAYTLDFRGGTYYGNVVSYYVVAGTFHGTVNTQDTDISSGTFNGEVSCGIIDGGTFNAAVVNCNNITDGTFNGDVNTVAWASISGGTFAAGKTVTCGTIYGGTFHGGVNCTGDLSGGTFSITSTVNSSGSYIDGGNFYGIVNQSEQAIYGGHFHSTCLLTTGGCIGGTVDGKVVIPGGTAIYSPNSYWTTNPNNVLTTATNMGTAGNYVPVVAANVRSGVEFGA